MNIRLHVVALLNRILFVSFFRQMFCKMGLENCDSYMSNQVSLKDFRKWLIKSCTKDLEMQKKNITLKIKNNENIGNGDESETIPICFSEVDRRN